MKQKKNGLIGGVLFLLSAVMLMGQSCGYHFPGTAELPGGIKSVSFDDFANYTLRPGIEKELQWAIEDEFRTRGLVRVTEAGDGVLSATLQELDVSPRSFDRRDQVLEYELTLLLEVQLRDRGSEEILWQTSNLRITQHYSAIPQVLVTTSPEFLKVTLDPADLPGLTDVQFSETQRRQALDRLFSAAAREIYFRLGDNF